MAPSSLLDDDTEAELKATVKSALEWAREAEERIKVPPARPEGAAEHGSGTSATTTPRNGDEIDGFQGQMTLIPVRPRTNPIVPQRADPPGISTANGFNLLRETRVFVKDILEHPVTWLLVPLVVFASLGVWIVQGRSPLQPRRSARRGARSRSGALAAGRSQLQNRTAGGSNGTMPLPPHGRTRSMPPRTTSPKRERSSGKR